MRKFLISLLAACCCLAACEKVSPENTPGGSTPGGSAPTDEIPAAVKIQSVLFRVKDTGEWVESLDLSLLERQTASLEVKITPENSTEKVTFKSDNTMIARISRQGIITARSAGKTDIHLMVGSEEMAVCHLEVQAPDVIVQDFELDNESLTMDWGRDAHVFVNKVTPSSIAIGDTYFTFLSSDEEIFTVETEFDGFGCAIHGVRPGKGNLTVSADGVERVIPVTITKRQLHENSLVITIPDDGYTKLHSAYSKDRRSGWAGLAAGFPHYLFLVDEYGERVYGEYGLQEYPEASRLPFVHAQWSVNGDSGICVYPLRGANIPSEKGTAYAKPWYDARSRKIITLDTDLYTLEVEGHPRESVYIGVETAARGFISFSEDDNLEICGKEWGSSGEIYSLKKSSDYYSDSFNVDIDTDLAVLIYDMTTEGRYLGEYVFMDYDANVENLKWFTWSSENGYIDIADYGGYEDTDDGDPMLLYFNYAGTDVLHVTDKFGHTRSLKFTIHE